MLTFNLKPTQDKSKAYFNYDKTTSTLTLTRSITLKQLRSLPAYIQSEFSTNNYSALTIIFGALVLMEWDKKYIRDTGNKIVNDLIKIVKTGRINNITIDLYRARYFVGDENYSYSNNDYAKHKEYLEKCKKRLSTAITQEPKKEYNKLVAKVDKAISEFAQKIEDPDYEVANYRTDKSIKNIVSLINAAKANEYSSYNKNICTWANTYNLVNKEKLSMNESDIVIDIFHDIFIPRLAAMLGSVSANPDRFMPIVHLDKLTVEVIQRRYEAFVALVKDTCE